jgi:hypothetical protein
MTNKSPRRRISDGELDDWSGGFRWAAPYLRARDLSAFPPSESSSRLARKRTALRR